MDDLRDRLVAVYGRSLACYSGRGGERWDGNRWVRVSKEEVKNAFRSGEIRVLLCTEAASEGLNLQTCGVLINYDMPWNPMRVEQRIGRFDRIGQVHPDVWVRHYFLVGPNHEETVEAKVYRALADRIDWFRAVVGELSPILARIERVIERAAVARREVREAVLQEALAEVRREIEAQSALPSLDEWAEAVAPEPGPNPPLDLADLERLLRQSTFGRRFRPHAQVPGAFYFDWAGRVWEVTFDPDVADAHPGRVRLLTYGEPLLDEVLKAVAGPAEAREGRGLVRAAAGEVRRWFAAADEGLEPVRNVAELEQCLGGKLPEISQGHLVRAAQRVEEIAQAASRRKESVELARASAAREALNESARSLVAQAAACLARLQGLGPREALGAVAAQGYPWAGLVKLAGYPDLRDVEEAREAVPADEAGARLEGLKARAKAILRRLAQHRESEPRGGEAVSGSAVVYAAPEQP